MEDKGGEKAKCNGWARAGHGQGRTGAAAGWVFPVDMHRSLLPSHDWDNGRQGIIG